MKIFPNSFRCLKRQDTAMIILRNREEITAVRGVRGKIFGGSIFRKKMYVKIAGESKTQRNILVFFRSDDLDPRRAAYLCTSLLLYSLYIYCLAVSAYFILSTDGPERSGVIIKNKPLQYYIIVVLSLSHSTRRTR